MRVKTAVASVVAAGILMAGYAGLQVASERAPSSSRDMAKPRKYKVPEGEDRAVVVLQVCWYPADKATVTVGWSLGAVAVNLDRVGPPLNCQTPWQRKAVLDRGQRAAVGWTLNGGGPVAKFQWRITVNNRQRLGGDSPANAGMYFCIIGQPPCQLP